MSTLKSAAPKAQLITLRTSSTTNPCGRRAFVAPGSLRNFINGFNNLCDHCCQFDFLERDSHCPGNDFRDKSVYSRADKLGDKRGSGGFSRCRAIADRRYAEADQSAFLDIINSGDWRD
ncbi:unnamed protein product [Diplocarpon coronariae]